MDILKKSINRLHYKYINLTGGLGYLFFSFSRILRYNISKRPAPFPIYIQIQTTNNCNASCIMCPNTYNKNKKIEVMSDNLFKKIVNEIAEEAQIAYLHLYYQNEPLMDENIFKKINLIKQSDKGKLFTIVSSLTRSQPIS